MQKVPGVTSVKVSLNEGLTILDFARENTVTLAQLRQVIRNNGFVTNESRIIARGAIVTSTFEVRGTKERLALSNAQPDRADLVVSGSVNTRDPKRMILSITKLDDHPSSAVPRPRSAACRAPGRGTVPSR